MSDFNCFFTFDKSYSEAALVMICSLLRQSSSPSRYHLWIVTDQPLDSRTEELITGCGARFTILPLPEKAREYADAFPGRISPYQMVRLCLLDMLPASVSTILSLDTDIIILKSIDNLFSLPPDEFEWAAVRDFTYPLWGYYPVYEFCREDLPASTPYFNCGVYLANLDRWRSFDFTGRVEEYISRYEGKLVYVEQDLLNLIFSGRTYVLPLSYNRSVSAPAAEVWFQRIYSREQSLKSLANQHILHFYGSDKPGKWKTRRARNCYEFFARAAGVSEAYIDGTRNLSPSPSMLRLRELVAGPIDNTVHRILKGIRYKLPISGLIKILFYRIARKPYLAVLYPFLIPSKIKKLFVTKLFS